MSLTSFLKNQDVKEKFAQQFPMPEFNLEKEILAPPRTKRYAMVGTAFDYLLRFYLKRLNPAAVTSQWVAESSLNIVTEKAIQEAGFEVAIVAETREIFAFDPKGMREVPPPETELIRKVKQILQQAEAVYNGYLSSGEMTNKVIDLDFIHLVDEIKRAG